MLLHGLACQSPSHPVPGRWGLPFLSPLSLPPLVRVRVGKEESRHSHLPGLLDPGRRFGESPGHRQEFTEMHPQRANWEQQMHLSWTTQQLATPWSFTTGWFRGCPGQPRDNQHAWIGSCSMIHDEGHLRSRRN